MSDSKLHPLIKNAETIPPKETILVPRVNPLVASMPSHLKDHRNFEKIQRALLETLAGRHSHAEMEDWAKCLTCMRKMQDHAFMMRKLGFNSAAQYRVWLKIHTKIKEYQKVKLRKYNS